MSSNIQWNNFYGTVIYSTIPGLIIEEDWIKEDNKVFFSNMKDDQLIDKDNRRIHNVLCGISRSLRNVQNGYLVYHRMGPTDKCTFTAETHFHLVSECKNKNGMTRDKNNGIWHLNFFKELTEICTQNCFQVKSEKLISAEAMTGYLHVAPRKLVGTTSRAMDVFWTSTKAKEALQTKSGNDGAKNKRKRKAPDDVTGTGSEDEFESPKKKPKRPGDHIKILQEMMKKYKKTDLFKLIRSAIQADNQEDADILLDYLGRGSQARVLAQNAARLLSSGDPRTYSEIFMEETSEESVREAYGLNVLDVEQTHELFKKWAKEKRNAIKSAAYWLVSIYSVVFQKVPKLNTFLCVGAPSSGKTFWTDPVLWLQQYVGLSANDSHFCFAELSHSKIGLINELRFNRDTLDIYKQIGEGKDCMVPVKNNGLGGCDSQPIIITVNTEPWAAVPEGRDAMEERSFLFHFNSKSQLVHGVKSYV